MKPREFTGGVAQGITISEVKNVAMLHVGGEGGGCIPLPLGASRALKNSEVLVRHMNLTHRQIVHSRAPSNCTHPQLQQPSTLRRSVSNLLRYSCRSVPQSTSGTPKAKPRACYSLRGLTIWRESSTFFTSIRRMRQAFTGSHCQGQGRTENALREL